jgi:hypothetical protein
VSHVGMVSQSHSGGSVCRINYTCLASPVGLQPASLSPHVVGPSELSEQLCFTETVSAAYLEKGYQCWSVMNSGPCLVHLQSRVYNT